MREAVRHWATERGEGWYPCACGWRGPSKEALARHLEHRGSAPAERQFFANRGSDHELGERVTSDGAIPECACGARTFDARDWRDRTRHRRMFDENYRGAFVELRRQVQKALRAEQPLRTDDWAGDADTVQPAALPPAPALRHGLVNDPRMELLDGRYRCLCGYVPNRYAEKSHDGRATDEARARMMIEASVVGHVRSARERQRTHVRVDAGGGEIRCACGEAPRDPDAWEEHFARVARHRERRGRYVQVVRGGAPGLGKRA